MKLNGIGKFIFSNGGFFQGQFIKNIANGPCRYETQKKIFKGNFIDGAPVGTGQIYSKPENQKLKELNWTVGEWEKETGLSLEYLRVENFD